LQPPAGAVPLRLAPGRPDVPRVPDRRDDELLPLRVLRQGRRLRDGRRGRRLRPRRGPGSEREGPKQRRRGRRAHPPAAAPPRRPAAPPAAPGFAPGGPAGGGKPAEGGLGGQPGEPLQPSPGPNLDNVAARKNLNETAFFFPTIVSDNEGVVRIEFTMPEA